jgi:hypothetical protein
MNRRNLDLVIVGVIAVLGCVAAAAHAPTAVTIVLGVGLLVVPGYLWTEVLLKRGGLDFERVMIGTGLALMLPIFGGLVLYAAGISLHRAAWIGLLAGEAIAGVAVVAILRRNSESSEPGTRTKLRIHLPVRHALIYGAAAVFAVSTVVIAVISADKQSQPGYTQLWMAPVKNNEALASLAVNNEQGSTVVYRLQLLKKGRVSATWNLTLANGQTWQRDIPYTSKYSVAANLYRLPNLRDPYRTVGNNR